MPEGYKSMPDRNAAVEPVVSSMAGTVYTVPVSVSEDEEDRSLASVPERSINCWARR